MDVRYLLVTGNWFHNI